MPFPAPPPPVPPTPLAEVDAAIERLHAKKDDWLAVGLPERVALLERCVAAIASVAERWAAIGASIKGLAPDDVLAGEEWIAGVMPTVRNARLLAEALRAGGQRTPTAVRPAPNGQLVARVHPASLMERLMFMGVTVDVWIEKGKPATQGSIYRDRAAKDGKGGAVCLVLGGGNVSSIPAMDVLYKLFVEDEVVLLKMNPVNEALGPVLEDALRPLVDQGVLAIVSGGAEVGGHAAQHAKVGSLHVTGSDRTYDAIVWSGDPEERARRKKSGEKSNERRFTAELGCVTPVIVVPGPWSAADIRFQARHVASMVTQNASFNCNAAKVVITARGWLQREAFLDALHQELRKTRARKAYYPGARERHRAFLENYPGALILGAVPEDSEEVVPWTAIPDVSSDAGGYALTNEAFCGVVAEVTLDLTENEGGVLRERDHGGPSVTRFLERAVAFANERCWGTLSCCILIDHATRDDHADALTRAVTDLRYGGIGINAWPGLIYGLVTPSWGAFPGHTAEDIQSGTGVVHNAFLFDHPEKSVVRAPFRMSPTPPWFSDHRNLRVLGKRLVAFEAKPSWGAFFGVVRAALRG
jgi:acyl-CoA reductase-like NAD-dependent aldehyde dehydrogenase